MSMSAEWRLIDSGSVPPSESAAIDEAILDVHSRGAVPNTLHFYVRSRPTISIGYSQRARETVDLDECRRMGVAVIRRVSGGGTIYTDQGQLIYGLVVRETDLPASREESFAMVCGAIADTISSLGVDARVKPVNDVEVSGKKVSGSAQMRRRGSVLQHGTILIDTDTRMMDEVLMVRGSGASRRASDRVANLAAITSSRPDVADIKSRLASRLEDAFAIRFSSQALSEEERARIESLVRERYSKDSWNLKF